MSLVSGPTSPPHRPPPVTKLDVHRRGHVDVGDVGEVTSMWSTVGNFIKFPVNSLVSVEGNSPRLSRLFGVAFRLLLWLRLFLPARVPSVLFLLAILFT